MTVVRIDELQAINVSVIVQGRSLEVAPQIGPIKENANVCYPQMQLILSDLFAFAIDVTIQQAHAYFNRKLMSGISIDLDTSSSNPSQPYSSENHLSGVGFKSRCTACASTAFLASGQWPTLTSSLLYRVVVIGSDVNGQR